MKGVSLQLGDLFESGPCDLLVLPCSTAGTVADFVLKRIQQFNLPWPKSGIHGEIELIDRQAIKGLVSLSPRLAYAYSVKGNSAEIDAIRSIGREIGNLLVEDEGISRVFVPMLGAGAGGLDRVLVWQALRDGFMDAENVKGQLIVLTPSERIFHEVSRKTTPYNTSSLVTQGGTNVSHQSLQSNDLAPKRVFISYTSKGEKVQEWVKDFATELRNAGLNARLDLWDLKPGMDLPDFMASEICQADRVIIVSDTFYAERANGKIGGVGWETMLIQGDYLSNNLGTTKYLLVTLGQDRISSTPQYLKTRYSLHFPLEALTKESLKPLVLELHSIDQRPPIKPLSEWLMMDLN